MIDQGTDGISRGIQLTGGQFKWSPRAEVLCIFDSILVTQGSMSWALLEVRPHCRHQAIQLMDSLSHWSFGDVCRRATLWFPAPEWAHQLLDRLVSAWTEQPWEMEAFLLIPRVFQRDWGRVSKHVVELGTYPAAQVPGYAGHSDIPCVLMHLPCYVRSLPSPRRMDFPSRPKGVEWHREQAEYMRGLS
jgi:hypothetical protein